MKILVINGSPKGARSNTMKLTNAFLEGIGEADVRVMDVSKMKVAPCRGCFCCWNKTPGKCVIADDMQSVIDAQLWADLIIWSFPLYYFNVPGGLKNLIDRQLPMCLPFMTDDESNTGSGSHPARYDLSGKRHVLISTCGFYSAERNYDSVRSMFDHFCGAGRYETIFCGQGELFRVPELRSRTDEYLASVRKAGSEFASGGITRGTKSALQELLYPREVFEAMADASWGIEESGKKTEDPSLSFTRQMAALYNKNSYDGKPRVLEICYTDLGKTYQILLDKDGSKVVTDGSLTPTTRIDTPWDVWGAISRGEIRGDAALAEGKYKVSGDFSLMIHWDQYFGAASAHEKEAAAVPEKKPLMIAALLPWIALWAGVSISVKWGAIATIAICLGIPLLMTGRKLTVYDRISILTAGSLAVLATQPGMADTSLLLGYLGFGLMWLLSCFTKEPLCAAYVKYNYSGDDALENPIFMKTNYILATVWGILYILVAVWSFFLYRAGLHSAAVWINNGATILMGLFTAWFESWYPAHVALGK